MPPRPSDDDNEEKLSLAERMKAKKEAADDTDDKEGMSLAERMKAKKEAADDADDKEGMSLAERIKAKKKAADDTDDESGLSLAERMKAKRSKNKKASLADRLQSKVEQQAAAAKATLEDADPLDDEAAEALSKRLNELKDRYQELLRRVEMTDLIEETTRLGNDIEDLPESLTEVRRRGYTFRSYLENKIEVIAEQWDDINGKIDSWIEGASDDTEEKLAKGQAYVQVFAEEPLTGKQEQAANQLEALLDTVETQVDVAEERVRVLYDEVQREVRETNSQLRQIVNYLDLADEAAFELDGGESIYMVAKAEWDDGGEKPDGFLYLTNQRVLFEQKEKVGKTFGMFGGKEVQEILWEAPLSTLQEATNEDKGMFGGKDMVHMSFDSGASYGNLTVEIKGGVDSSIWSTQINRAASGKIDDESTVEPDPELIERLREAPTACPTCGATLPSIDEHTSEVNCKYCGSVIRI